MGLAAVFVREARSLLKKGTRRDMLDVIMPGRPPGEIPDRSDLVAPRIHLIAYSDTHLTEADIEDPEEIRRFLGEWPVVWVNVDGLGDSKIIKKIGELFGLHTLALEDVLTLHQRPKIESFENHLFWVVRMLENGEPVRTEQLSLFFDKHFVLTFQEHPGDCLDCIRKRIRENGGRVRRMGADYLAYCLVDAVIDFYFPFLDEFTERLESLEAEVLRRPTQRLMVKLHRAKRDLLTLRRAVAPLREVFNQLLRDEDSVFSDITRVYLRDGYDHVVQILELIETHREITSSLLEVYLTSVSNRTNDITKLLTIIATVFIPLSFLTGIYGMNFDVDASPYNMPELRWRFGYPAFLLIAFCVALVELVVFWRKGWFKQSIEIDDDKRDED